MSPKPRPYEVWIIHRGRKVANKTKVTVDRNDFPETISVDGTTYYWMGLDDRLHMVVYSETDPRVGL